MSSFIGLGLLDENRTPRCRPTTWNMASQDHPSGGKPDSRTQKSPCVAGNALYKLGTEESLHPQKPKWNLSEMGYKYSRKSVKSKTQEGLEGLKTSKIARKLGEIAVANDLAYVPRMSDDALVGINEDERHSRDSYVQAHHSAIDFTRSLPKGSQPAYYNPDTHVLVPRQEQPRPHTIHQPLQAEHTQEPIFDLLDMEFMTNKPSTVPAVMPSITVSMMEDTENARNDVLSTSQCTHNKPRTRPAPREVPLVPGTSLRPTDSIQRSSAQPPRQIRSAELPPSRVPSRPPNSIRRDNHSELFYSPPPTFQDHSTYDILRTDQHPPMLPPIQTTVSRHPTFRNSPTTAYPVRPLKHDHPYQYHQPRPPATWSSPTPTQSPSPLPPPRHRPKTIIPLPYNPHPDPNAELYLPPAPKTPPLSLEEIETFSPKPGDLIPPLSRDSDMNVSLSRTDSQERRIRTKNARRGTVVHRQKTSQEIWEGKFEVEAECTRVRIEREIREKKEMEKERELTAEPQLSIKTLERQAADRVAFERRHQERLRQMQASVAANQQQPQARNQSKFQFRPRPNARTFQAGEEGHRLRTKEDINVTPLDGERETGSRIQGKEERGANNGGQMRATARTFETEKGEHTIRWGSQRVQHADTHGPYTRPEYQPQPQPQTNANTNTNTRTRWQPNPNARTFEAANTTPKTETETDMEPGWQLNPSVRTFETMTSAGDVAAAKRYLSRKERR